jgi:AraC-like DNA-binding protein
MTPGYLHRLFSSESETVSRYILRRRLEECSRALRDPVQSRKSVTMIAFEHGFSSLPHFCRVFRERFALTPTDFRAS